MNKGGKKENKRRYQRPKTTQVQTCKTPSSPLKQVATAAPCFIFFASLTGQTMVLETTPGSQVRGQGSGG